MEVIFLARRAVESRSGQVRAFVARRGPLLRGGARRGKIICTGEERYGDSSGRLRSRFAIDSDWCDSP